MRPNGPRPSARPSPTWSPGSVRPGWTSFPDGEQTKTGFFAYIGERLSGFEPRPGRDPLAGFRAEIESFPEYYEQYLKGAMTGGMAAPAVPLACTGPVAYT